MIQDILQAITDGREWSWSVIGILAILAGLTVRAILLRDILHGMKIRNREWYQRTQLYYQKRSLVGWIFFILFVTGTTLLWRFETVFLIYLNSSQWLLVLLALLVLSLICHLRAYARAIVEAVDEHMAADKDI